MVTLKEKEIIRRRAKPTGSTTSSEGGQLTLSAGPSHRRDRSELEEARPVQRSNISQGGKQHSNTAGAAPWPFPTTIVPGFRPPWNRQNITAQQRRIMVVWGPTKEDLRDEIGWFRDKRICVWAGRPGTHPIRLPGIRNSKGDYLDVIYVFCSEEVVAVRIAGLSR